MSDDYGARILVLERGMDDIKAHRVAERLASLEVGNGHIQQNIQRIEDSQKSTFTRINTILGLLVTTIILFAGWLISDMGGG